ncbi:MAG: crotonase/enoyl-CoA hydratase family protein [Sphingomonadales bacterium]|jgi:enoyl-CoA hydratase
MISVERKGEIAVVSLNRSAVRNAVDDATAEALYDAALAFDEDPSLSVMILSGSGGHFCAGADLKAVAKGERRAIRETGIAPMGPSRLQLSKPVIAAVEGYAVAGGLELALWCDMRVAAKSAIFGVYCRRFGVPLIDLGTIRLPRLIGHGRAMDMILTGRSVEASEAMEIGLVNRLVEDGEALSAALELAEQIAAFPQKCMRGDRMSAIEQWDLPWDEAVRREFNHGMEALSSGETRTGATAFTEGAGRHGGKREG